MFNGSFFGEEWKTGGKAKKNHERKIYPLGIRWGGFRGSVRIHWLLLTQRLGTCGGKKHVKKGGPIRGGGSRTARPVPETHETVLGTVSSCASVHGHDLEKGGRVSQRHALYCEFHEKTGGEVPVVELGSVGVGSSHLFGREDKGTPVFGVEGEGGVKASSLRIIAKGKRGKQIQTKTKSHGELGTLRRSAVGGFGRQGARTYRKGGGRDQTMLDSEKVLLAACNGFWEKGTKGLRGGGAGLGWQITVGGILTGLAFALGGVVSG